MDGDVLQGTPSGTEGREGLIFGLWQDVVVSVAGRERLRLYKITEWEKSIASVFFFYFKKSR